MTTDERLKLAWDLFADELELNENDPTYAVHVLAEALEYARLTGVTLDELADYARRQWRKQWDSGCNAIPEADRANDRV